MKIGLLGIDQSNNDEIRIIKEIKSIHLSGYYNIYDSYISEIAFQNLDLFADFESLLANSDSIIIFGSLLKYYELAINAIKKGKHILVKNVFGIPYNKLQAIFKLSYEANVKIQIIQTSKFQPLNLYARENLENPFYLEINRNRNLPDNKERLFNHLLNDISISLHLFNTSIKKIFTRKSPQKSEFYDLVSVRIEFITGAEVLIKYNALTDKNSFNQYLYSDLKLAVMDFEKNKCTIFYRKDSKIKKQNPLFDLHDPLKSELNVFIRNCELYESPQYFEYSKDLELIGVINKTWEDLSL